MGGTYSGNAISCAAGVECANVMQEEKILDNVNARSVELFTALKELQNDPETKDFIADGMFQIILRFLYNEIFSSWIRSYDWSRIRQLNEASNSISSYQELNSRQHWGKGTEKMPRKGFDVVNNICI